jgi:chromosomal replication initiation ATPase DnaA
MATAPEESERAFVILSDEQIDEQISLLEQRKLKLMKIKKLEMEVAQLETNAMRSETDLKGSLLRIEGIVAEYFQLSVPQLRSRARPEYIALPRQIIFYIARHTTTAPSEMIARIYGRDHGTVLYGDKAVAEKMTIDAALLKTVKTLIEKCRAAAGEEPVNGKPALPASTPDPQPA